VSVVGQPVRAPADHMSTWTRRTAAAVRRVSCRPLSANSEVISTFRAGLPGEYREVPDHLSATWGEETANRNGRRSVRNHGMSRGGVPPATCGHPSYVPRDNGLK